MDPNLVAIGIVLDRSGSMHATQKDAEGGFNTFIAEQRKIPNKTILVTLSQFDTVYERVYQNRLISEVPPLHLEPRGGTALLDAVARTIDEMGAGFAEAPESARPSRVFLLIVTDGQENSSIDYALSKNGLERVRAKIEHQKSKYSWEIIFVGSDPTTMSFAAGMGITRDHTLSYAPTSGSTHATYGVLGQTMSASVAAGTPYYINPQNRADALDGEADPTAGSPDPADAQANLIPDLTAPVPAPNQTSPTNPVISTSNTTVSAVKPRSAKAPREVKSGS